MPNLTRHFNTLTHPTHLNINLYTYEIGRYRRIVQNGSNNLNEFSRLLQDMTVQAAEPH